MTRLPECIESLCGLLRAENVPLLPLSIITAPSAVRLVGRELFVRAAAVADVSRVPLDTTHIMAIGRDATALYCLADTHPRGEPVARLTKVLHVVHVLDEDAWIRQPPQSEIQRAFVDDLFRHAYWWDDNP